MLYTAQNWYWLADDGRLFSSGAGALVEPTDDAYLSWCEAGGRATAWPRDAAGLQSDAALQEVLTPHRCYVTLDALKSALRQAIDEAAETERARWITLGAGQAMTYQAKAIEAAAISSDPSPDPAGYPLLAAEIGITAPDLAGVAAVVLAQHAAWTAAGAAIEAARLSGKADVTAAADATAARAAAVVIWPAPPTN